MSESLWSKTTDIPKRATLPGDLTADAAVIGARENISPERARQLQAKSLRTLRRPEHTKRLKGFMDEIIQSKAYQGTGFEAWKARGSVEERLVEYYEERERHYAMLAERGITLPGTTQ